MTFDNSTSKNFQYSTVAVAPTTPLVGLSLTVQPTDGAKFAEAPFWAFVCALETQPLEANSEVIRITEKTGDKFTIERAQQGSVAQEIATGWVIFAGDSAESWAEVHAAIEAETSARKTAVMTAEANAVAVASAAQAAAEAASDSLGSATTAEGKAIAAAATKANTAESNAIAAAATKANTAQSNAESAATADVAIETARAKKGEKEAQEKAEAASDKVGAAATAQTAAEAAATAGTKTEREAREAADALKAPLASPALTGTPTVPTATKGTSTTQAASTAFVQTAAAEAISGLTAHTNVKYATAVALPTNTYLSGVITGTALAALAVDGETVEVGQRILVKNEAAEAHNGLYVVTHAGGVAEAFVLTRAADMASTSAEVEKAYTFVEAGKTLKNSGWFVATPGPFTLGTTAIPWGRLPGSGDLVPGEGITIDGNVVAVSSSVARGSAGLGANTVLGSEHGIVGDNVTDDTNAFIAALTAAFELAKNTTGKAVLDISMYDAILLAGSLKQDAFGGNSQVLLPYVEDGNEHENVGVTIRGKPGIISRMHWSSAPLGGTTIRSNLTGVSYESALGIPSMIGGPTGAVAVNFSRLNLKVENITFKQPENPQLTCLNVGYLNAFEYDNLVCCTEARGIVETECTHKWAYGVIFPVVNTRGPIIGRGHNYFNGYYAGYLLGENLACDGAMESMCCNVAVGHAELFHANYIAWLQTLKCTYHHAQVSPTGGAEEFSHNAALKVGNWDIEDAKSGATFQTKYHVWDKGTHLALEGTFDQLVPSGAGTAPEIKMPETLNTTAIKLRYLKTNLGFIAAPAVEASGKFVLNPYWRTCAVYINPNGATITEIKTSGTATGVTSGLVILPPGMTINLFYSGGTPTWKWFVIA